MNRRTFTKTLGAGFLAAGETVAQTSARRGNIGVITNAEGAHLGSYFSALAKADEVTSVALADPTGKTVAAATKALGKKLSAVYPVPPEMLAKEKPVMTIVSLEARLAPPAIELALDAGSHVMAEKPACLNANDFANLAAKADGKKLLLMLALANRLNPETREARRLLRDGRIGKIYGMELHMIADQTRLESKRYHGNWYAQKARAGGGHLIWLGIHWLDLAMHLSGSNITEVTGFAGNVGGQPIDVEDSAALAMRFDNGTFGTMTSGYYLDKGYHSHIKIWGSEGWIEINRHGDPGAPLRWFSEKDDKPQVREFRPPDVPQGYSPFVAACVRASLGLADPPLTTQDSLQVIRTVFAAYRAAETGRAQKV